MSALALTPDEVADRWPRLRDEGEAMAEERAAHLVRALLDHDDAERALFRLGGDAEPLERVRLGAWLRLHRPAEVEARWTNATALLTSDVIDVDLLLDASADRHPACLVGAVAAVARRPAALVSTAVRRLGSAPDRGVEVALLRAALQHDPRPDTMVLQSLGYASRAQPWEVQEALDALLAAGASSDPNGPVELQLAAGLATHLVQPELALRLLDHDLAMSPAGASIHERRVARAKGVLAVLEGDVAGAAASLRPSIERGADLAHNPWRVWRFLAEHGREDAVDEHLSCCVRSDDAEQEAWRDALAGRRPIPERGLLEPLLTTVRTVATASPGLGIVPSQVATAVAGLRSRLLRAERLPDGGLAQALDVWTVSEHTP